MFIYVSVVDIYLVIPDLLIIFCHRLACFLVPKVIVLVRIAVNQLSTSFPVIKLVSICLGCCVRSWSGLGHQAAEPSSSAGSINNIPSCCSETVTYEATIPAWLTELTSELQVVVTAWKAKANIIVRIVGSISVICFPLFVWNDLRQVDIHTLKSLFFPT